MPSQLCLKGYLTQSGSPTTYNEIKNFTVVQEDRVDLKRNRLHFIRKFFKTNTSTPRQKSIRALEIFRVQKLILNATS